MNAALGECGWGGVFVKLVENKSGSRVEWILKMTETENAAADARSLGCAESFVVANDSGVTNGRRTLAMSDCREALETAEDETQYPRESEDVAAAYQESWTHGCVIPWMDAVADPQEKYWERLRGNPKRLGEISQAAFLLKAEMKGFHLALPWGDSERYDFVVWGNNGRAYRVQVKGTGRLHLRGYEVQPVHSTRGQGKKRYTKKDIDVIAAHVQPADAWYLIPIEKVGRAKSLRLYPDIASRRPMWERYREAWDVLGERGVADGTAGSSLRSE